MSGFLEGKTTKQNMPVKQFGYVVSAILLVCSGIGMIAEWLYTPLLVLFTMYFLTGSLWIPALIKPFYSLFGKYFFKLNTLYSMVF